jgi:RNA polymerase sigma-70 factor (ECF subfamily)
MLVGVDAATEFAEHRGLLFGIAYRMLGSAADSEDLVQEAFVRWWRADREAITAPRPWLVRTLTNLCLNHLDSARVRREQYVGPWLPEPVCSEEGALNALAEQAQRAESASFAVLVLLEQLTPRERAAFVLREAFDYDHASIADVLGTSTANSRQLHSRASRRVRGARPRFSAERESWHRLVERFLAAARGGDVAELERLLAADAVAWADGGGKASAARRAVVGGDRVARYLAGLAHRIGELVVQLREVNGDPAAVVLAGDEVVAVLVPAESDGRIGVLRSITNPDKLRFLQRQLSHRGELSGPG